MTDIRALAERLREIQEMYLDENAFWSDADKRLKSALPEIIKAVTENAELKRQLSVCLEFMENPARFECQLHLNSISGSLPDPFAKLIDDVRRASRPSNTGKE